MTVFIALAVLMFVGLVVMLIALVLELDGTFIASAIITICLWGIFTTLLIVSAGIGIANTAT